MTPTDQDGEQPAAELSPEDQALARILAKIPTFTVEKQMKLFLQTRAAKTAATRAHDAQDAKYKLLMDACENSMLAESQRQGVKGFKTDVGTSYTSETLKVSVADADAFYNFVRSTGDLDFFERRVSSKHVEDYMKANEGASPPGLSLFRELAMRVRKA